MYKEELSYSETYGHLPNTQEELIEYFETHHKIDWTRVNALKEHIESLEWNYLEIELPLVPKPTPRPRYSSITKTFYVKGAKKTKKLVEKHISNLGLIATRVEFDLEVYQLTPSNMCVSEAYLAEKGLIRPISKPDFDNVAKTYSDAIQDVLLVNDNIINPGSVKKYYSIKPRVIIKIRYQSGYDCPFNQRKILESKGYQELLKNRGEE